MDQPIINEASFTAANPSSYSLAEIWPFPINGGETAIDGGLGLKMSNFSGFGEVTSESTVTDQSGSRGKKRKEVNSEDDSSKVASTSRRNDLDKLGGKRVKSSGFVDETNRPKSEIETNLGSRNRPAEQKTKSSEPPKQDYIHVRARRGQATDSHSLAERARREKISERMKVLQDLVPGCNKVIGKALVLDEIINYIQSLQRQVEFLSMKIEAVTRMEPSMELGPPAFDMTGMLFGSQAAREYMQGPQPEWLQMHPRSSFDRAP